MPPADIPSVPGIGLPPPAAAPAAPSGTLADNARGPPLPVSLSDQAHIRPLDLPHALQILIFEVQAALEAALLQALAPPAAAGAPNETALLLEALLTPPADGGAPDGGLPPDTGVPPPPGAGTPDPTLAADAPALAQALTTLLQPALLPGAFTPAGALSLLSAPPLAPPDAAHQSVELLLQALPPETSDDAALGLRLPALLAAVDSANAQALAIVSSWRDVPVAVRDATQAATLLIANVFSDEPLQAVWLRPEWAGFLPRLEQLRRRRRRLRRRLEDPDAQAAPREDEARR